jgi:cell wall-associated NlpC family hydrolase
LELNASSIDQGLVDDGLPPDEDDFDTVDVPDFAVLEPEAPPAEAEEGDQAVAGQGPIAPAQQDAPSNAQFPEDDGALLGPDFDGFVVPISDGPHSEDAIVRRWRARLRIRQQLLDDAKGELARAVTPSEVSAAQAKVAKREAQVASAKRVLERRKTTVIERLIRAAWLALAHRSLVHYTQDRPFELSAQGGRPRRWDGIRLGLRGKNGQFPRYADCSSFVTWCYWDALGGPNAGQDIINGEGWSSGYTGTQLDCGREVPISQARPGDLAFYNRGGSIGHVALVVAPGMVISHGSESGPSRPSIDWDGQLRHVRRYLS